MHLQNYSGSFGRKIIFNEILGRREQEIVSVIFSIIGIGISESAKFAAFCRNVVQSSFNINTRQVTVCGRINQN